MENVPKVLVVDDSKAIVDLIERMLNREGYLVVKAHDGEEALQKVFEEKPDLVVLDISMPKMDGLDVCRRLKGNEKTRLIPIVMLTGRDYVEDKIEGLITGADDYITKPFNNKEFLVRVKGLLDKTIYQRKRTEEEKNEAIEGMAESVAHEVRNPIAAIGGFARRIRDRLSQGDTLRTYADHIIREAERLERMVSAISELSSTAVSLNEQVNVSEVLDTALTDIDKEIIEKSVAVEKYYDMDVPVIVGDRKSLIKVFNNVIKNALESMCEGGCLTLKTGLNKKQIIVNVIDSGKGMSEGDILQVFRPFYTSKMAGAGVGLLVAKHIVLLHGGNISISSKTGEGTNVTVMLSTDN